MEAAGSQAEVLVEVEGEVGDMIQIKRVYEKAEKSDGYRILVDRLWPRGISKENAKIDLWLRDISPSHELRKWFHHKEQKWEEFEKKYKEELKEKKEFIKQIKEIEKKEKMVTLLFGAKDEEHNNAMVLLDVLK